MAKTIGFLAIILLLIVTLVITSTSVIAPDDRQVRVFIEFEEQANANIINNAGGRVLHSYEILPNVLAVEIPEAALNGILNNPNVVGFEYDVEVYALPRPSPQQPAQVLPWGIDRIDAELVEATGEGIRVCIVDTGIDRDHPDLAANIVSGRNFVVSGRRLDSTKWEDDNGHGTHVAGTLAALDNNIGVVGVAPRASLLVAKVLNRQGSGYLSDVIAGINYCVNSNADIISMSLGTSSNVLSFENAVNAAYNSGVLLIAAAGNSGGSVIYPAAYDSVIAVSATDSNDDIAYFSSRGPEIELAAPGVNILSTWISDSYNTISGTSMATPHVSGVAALAMQTNPLLTNEEIRTLLQNTADDLGDEGRDNLFGYGIVDAELN